MPDYTIRIGRAADAPALAALKAPYVRETPYTFAWQPRTAEEFAADIEATLARYPLLVAEGADGAALGYAQAEPYRSREADQWNVELTIYLAQGTRGRGVGSALYGELLRLLRLQHVQNAYACITASNEASLTFHRKFGFTEVGRFPKTGFKLGAWHDTVYLWKRLGEENAAPAPFIPFSNLDTSLMAAPLP